MLADRALMAGKNFFLTGHASRDSEYKEKQNCFYIFHILTAAGSLSPLKLKIISIFLGSFVSGGFAKQGIKKLSPMML
jgi:hypothetical protein